MAGTSLGTRHFCPNGVKLIHGYSFSIQTRPSLGTLSTISG